MLPIIFIFICIISTVYPDNVGIQFRVGHFRPSSHLFRNIYGQGGIEYEAELNYEYVPGYTIWLNINSFERDGIAPDNQQTKIQLHPLSGGIKQLIPFSPTINPYLGLGSTCTFIHVKGKSLFLDERDHKHKWGVVGKSGILVLVSSYFFVDIFADYYYTEIIFDEQKRNVGGLRAGVGIGLLF